MTDIQGTLPLETVNDYYYEQPDNPYAVSELIGTHRTHYHWDSNGNLDYVNNGGLKRFFSWTIDNRLQGFTSFYHIGMYRYDASGERDLKLTGSLVDLWQNGQQIKIPVLDRAMLYPSALMTISERGYTKHYFAEGERILSLIEEGGRSVDSAAELDDRLPLISGEDYDEVFLNQTNHVQQFYAEKDWDGDYGEAVLNLPSLRDALWDAFSQGFMNHNGEYELYYYYADHLGGASVITDRDGYMYQTLDYAPFGELLLDLKDQNIQYNEPYRFTGYMRDQETGFDYAHARYRDSDIGFISVDPLWSKYPGLSPYVYAANNPIMYVDRDGKDAILVVFPNYMVDTETRLGKQPLGHAGVLLIDNTTGLTKYYEYGRYSTEDKTKGRVRNITIPNVVIGKDGKPTQKSLNKVFEKISKQSGQGGDIQGAYIEGNFKTMNDYAQKKLKESNVGNEEYDKNRAPYKLINNNCATFFDDVIKQDKNAKKKAPWIINPTPTNVAREYQDNFPKVEYNSSKKQTTSDIYNH